MKRMKIMKNKERKKKQFLINFFYENVLRIYKMFLS